MCQNFKKRGNHAFLYFWDILAPNFVVQHYFAMKFCRSIEKNKGYQLIPKLLLLLNDPALQSLKNMSFLSGQNMVWTDIVMGGEDYLNAIFFICDCVVVKLCVWLKMGWEKIL